MISPTRTTSPTASSRSIRRRRSGTLKWVRNNRYPRLAFNYVEGVLRPFEGVIFPGEGVRHRSRSGRSPIQFVSPRTARIRVKTGPDTRPPEPSLMLAGEPRSRCVVAVREDRRRTSLHQQRRFAHDLREAVADRASRRGRQAPDADPEVRSTSNRRCPLRSPSRTSGAHPITRGASPRCSRCRPGEKLFGGGESFTRLDKRGQKLVLSVNDANGAESERMYKPIPFLMSNRGYGMFTHTSAPATFDVGATFHGSNALLLGDDEVDLFAFLGTPKQVLDEYTHAHRQVADAAALVVRLLDEPHHATSPKRRCGTSRRSCASTASPRDVIHLDTGWFETDWRTDYQFSKTRFHDPAKMIADLKRDGFHVSLWQLPYFVPKNTLFPEIVEQGLAVRDGKGNLPSEDAVLDFSNPKTVTWYQDKLAALLKLGRRRDQGRLRRSGAVQRRLRIGPHRASTSTTSTRCATTRRSRMSPGRSTART